MRMMLKFTVPVEVGNRTIKDGSLQKLLEKTIGKLNAEAAYFVAEAGVRSGMIFFDMKDSSQVAEISEPLFMQLNAQCDFFPVMNGEDLMKGFEAMMRAG